MFYNICNCVDRSILRQNLELDSIEIDIGVKYEIKRYKDLKTALCVVKQNLSIDPKYYSKMGLDSLE